VPKISIEKTSALSAEDAFSKIKDFLSDDKDLRKLDSNYKCQFDEKALSGTAKGKQFEARLAVAKGSPKTKVTLEVSLPLLLTPFKGFVEKTLNQKLDAVLG
jgi:hypothetical protein